MVLTARDEKRGLEAVEKLKQLSLPGLVVFHQLDVIDHASIRSFVDFIKNQFGKLDILVSSNLSFLFPFSCFLYVVINLSKEVDRAYLNFEFA